MVVFGKGVFFRAEVVVFVQSGCIRGKAVVFGESYFILVKVVVFLQSCSIRAKWLFSG